MIVEVHFGQARVRDEANLNFVAFDFREVCEGLKFHDVKILTDAVQGRIKSMRWPQCRSGLQIVGLPFPFPVWILSYKHSER